jgi:hypothetical protein
VGVGKLLPILGSGEQVPQAVGRLFLDFIDPDHVFTCAVIFSGC